MTAMRLIDADNVLKALGIFNDREHGDPHFLNGIETAREIVEQAPTVEAVFFRNGKWVKRETFYCLECDFDRIATGLKRAYEFLEVKAFSDKGFTRHAEMIKDAYMYLLKLHEVNADDEDGDGDAR